MYDVWQYSSLQFNIVGIHVMQSTYKKISDR